VIVTWPNLEQQTFNGDALVVDRYYRIIQGKNEPDQPRAK
jgi:hypothetical protein